MGHRKNPSLHIRFETLQELDKLEIWANRKGQKIVPWARHALKSWALYENETEIIQAAANYSIFEAVALLRERADPEARARAIQQADSFIEKVRADVAKKYK